MEELGNLVMPKKKYIVALTDSERDEFLKLITKGKTAAYKINHELILLKADINQEGEVWTDKQISSALNTSHTIIEKVRKRLVEESLESALER